VDVLTACHQALVADLWAAVVKRDEGQCGGWCRYAVPCRNRARVGSVTCGKHKHQEETVRHWDALDAEHAAKAQP